MFRPFKTVKTFAVIGLAAMGLGGCSQGEAPGLVSLGETIYDRTFGESDPPQDVATFIGTRPFLVARYGEAGAAFAVVDQQEDRVQFDSADGVEATLTNGYLSRLRGLGVELEAFYAERDSVYRSTAALREAVAAGTEHRRDMEYWIDREPVREAFLCRFEERPRAAAGFEIVETCDSVYREFSFTNLYRYNPDGTLWQSSQWFHPQAEQNLLIEHQIVRLAAS